MYYLYNIGVVFSHKFILITDILFFFSLGQFWLYFFQPLYYTNLVQVYPEPEFKIMNPYG